MDIYHAALRDSSRTTYGTGQKAFGRFLETLKGGVRFPFKQLELNGTELNLAFYMAFLLLEPTINKATTILGYETHVKYWFRTEGCPEYSYSTPFLRQIRKGIKNILSSSQDSRQPLLLPLVMSNPHFATVQSDDQRILRFATILGFIGMMRPHSLEALQLNSFSLVTQVGKILAMPKEPSRFTRTLMSSVRESNIIGYFVTFQSKTMRDARAHFPILDMDNERSKFSTICPIRALKELSQ